MGGAKEYLLLMLCWANWFFFSLSFKISCCIHHLGYGLCSTLLKSPGIFPFLSESLGLETEQSFRQVVPARGTTEKVGFRGRRGGFAPPDATSKRTVVGTVVPALSARCPPACQEGNRATAAWLLWVTASSPGAKGRVWDKSSPLHLSSFYCYFLLHAPS